MARPEKILTADEQAETRLFILENQLTMQALHDAKANIEAIDFIQTMRGEGRTMDDIKAFVREHAQKSEVVDRVNQMLKLNREQSKTVRKVCVGIVEDLDIA